MGSRNRDPGTSVVGKGEIVVTSIVSHPIAMPNLKTAQHVASFVTGGAVMTRQQYKETFKTR